MSMEDVGVRFQVGLELKNQKKKYIFSRLHTLHYVKQKVFESHIFGCALWPIDFAFLPDIY